METKNWLATVSGDATVNAIAREARVPQKTLDTQLRSATGLKPEMVIKIARAYGYSAVRALVDLGFLEASEALDAAGAEAIGLVEALRRATAEQLADEISERLAELERRRDEDEGGSNVASFTPKGPKRPPAARRERKVNLPAAEAARDD